MLVGEIRRPVVVQPSGNADILGVRFRVGGAKAFLRMPVSELRDAILPLDEALHLNPDQPIEPQLIQRLIEPRHFKSVRAAIRLIGRTRSSRHVAATIGVTERTLERAFNDCVGMSPKVFSR